MAALTSSRRSTYLRASNVAEVFDPADLNQDGVVNFLDEELAQIEARRAEMAAAKEAQRARREAGEARAGPDLGLSDLEKRRIAINQAEAVRRDSIPLQVPAQTPPSAVTGNPLGSAAAFREREIAAGLEVAVPGDLTDKKAAQTTDANN